MSRVACQVITLDTPGLDKAHARVHGRPLLFRATASRADVLCRSKAAPQAVGMPEELIPGQARETRTVVNDKRPACGRADYTPQASLAGDQVKQGPASPSPLFRKRPMCRDFI